MPPSPARPLERLKLRFSPPSLEWRYRLHAERRFRATRRLSIVLGIGLYVMFGALDRALYPGDHLTLWTIRYGLGLPPLLAAAWYLFQRGPRRRAEPVLAGAVLAAGLSIVAMIALVPACRDLYFAGLILVVMYGYTAVRLSFVHATLVGWLTVALFETVAFLAGMPHNSLVAANFFYLTANVIGMLAAYELERDARRSYALLMRLRGERARIVRLARHDGLTGLLNRRAFMEHLHREWSRAQRTGRPLALLLIDVDHFKRYNDSLGHAEGDVCLARLARILAEAARRPGDAAGRLGGEEFALVLAETGPEDAREHAERLRARIEAADLRHPDSPVSGRVTISVGVAATAPDAGSDPQALLTEADHALYTAKRGGRNRVEQARPRPARAGTGA